MPDVFTPIMTMQTMVSKTMLSKIHADFLLAKPLPNIGQSLDGHLLACVYMFCHFC